MKLIAAGTGYNNLFVTLGIFETEEKARAEFLRVGCVRKDDKRLLTTQGFVDWMHSHKLSCYSTGVHAEDGWTIEFRPIEINAISLGYDDD